jgi:hypothetical protein
LACYYILICIGVTFTLHFCGGNLESLSAASVKSTCEVVASKKKCCSEASKTNNDCCDNTIVDLSDVDNDSLFYEVSIGLHPLYLISNDSYFLQIPFVFNEKQPFPSFSFQGNAPPLYKLYGTYIHYA